MLHVVVTGTNGQLGSDFLKALSSIYKVTSITKENCDITDYSKLSALLNKIKPDFVINCAAYTKVDDAEVSIEECYAVNTTAVSNLARLSNEIDFTLIHFSTDYVFDSSNKEPINEDSYKNPINVYGKSKLEGEYEIIKNTKKYFIFRISWVYGLNGSNFPKTILNLAKSKKELKVVNDQIGSPTPTQLIVEVIMKILENSKTFGKKYGVYHISPNDSCSWFEVASEILDVIQNSDKFTLNKVIPVNSNEFPSPAQRPSYSFLNNKKIKDTFNIKPDNWKTYIRDYIHKSGSI